VAWQHPQLLWLALLAGGLALAYAVTLRARRRIPHPVRFPTDPLRRALAAGRRPRHLPAALLTAGVLLALLGAAGPTMALPSATGTPVVLIIDVSRSMEETDIAPSRIAAAITAGVEFARRLPRASRVSVVTFGNFASVVVPLTADRSRVIAAIEGLSTQLRTQLGTGLVEGVRAVTGEGGLPALPSPGTVRAVAVLLSDGRASDGIPPAEAAEVARERGVRVHTVGLGTAADPSTFRSGFFGVLDEPTLRMIADHTGGRYFRAEDARRLHEIYRDLARTIGWTHAPTDVSALAASAAMLLLLAAVILRLRNAPLG
jgi:Ca-activated chloride channel family protein